MGGKSLRRYKEFVVFGRILLRGLDWFGFRGLPYIIELAWSFF